MQGEGNWVQGYARIPRTSKGGLANEVTHMAKAKREVA
jgi:hypothetical protein